MKYMTREQALELLNSYAARLSEHFDAVQILASYLEPDGTTAAVASGQGNWYARQGMAHAFVERTRAEEIADEIQRDDEDEE
jgi:hypothetical protein